MKWSHDKKCFEFLMNFCLFIKNNFIEDKKFNQCSLSLVVTINVESLSLSLIASDNFVFSSLSEIKTAFNFEKIFCNY